MTTDGKEPETPDEDWSSERLEREGFAMEDELEAARERRRQEARAAEDAARAAAEPPPSTPPPAPKTISTLVVDVALLDTPPIRSYSTGNPQLDALIGGGLNTREVCAVMGPPGGCKTAWAISTAVHVQRAIPVLYACTELEQHELMARVAANVIGRPWGSIRRGAVARETYVEPLRGMRIHLIGCDVLPRQGDAALDLIEAEAARLAALYGVPPAVIIDYLQDLARGAEREMRSRVGDLATRIRGISQRIDCPMVVVSSVARTFYSMRRAQEFREADEPTVYLAAAKESGDVDYAAARVLFLDAEEDRDTPERAVRIAVAKSRDGRVGFAGARVEGATGRFRAAPEVLDEMSAPGQDDAEMTDERDAVDEVIFKRVVQEFAAGRRALCTQEQLRSGSGMGLPKVKASLARLIHAKRLRLVEIPRPEDRKTGPRTLAIYEPEGAST